VIRIVLHARSAPPIPSELLGTFDNGDAWITVDAPVLLDALDAGLRLPLLYLTRDAYDEATFGLNEMETREAVGKALEQSQRWPDYAPGVAYVNERNLLEAELSIDDRVAAAATLDRMARLLESGNTDAVEGAWTLVAEIDAVEREAMREGTLDAIAPFVSFAYAAATSRASWLARLERKDVALPIHVNIGHGVHFARLDRELAAAMRWHIPHVPVGEGCVAACTRSQLRSLRETWPDARVVIASAEELRFRIERQTLAQTREWLRAVTTDATPAAVRLLRAAFASAARQRAIEIILGRTDPRVDATNDVFFPLADSILGALHALGERPPSSNAARLRADARDDLLLLNALQP
jgi:hypothetical protein